MMSILLLVRNYQPAHEMAAVSARAFISLSQLTQSPQRGDWKTSDIARNAFDLEGKVVGTVRESP